MLDTDARRWVLGAIVVVAIVALLAWARNDPGVDDRDPDPPQASSPNRRSASTRRLRPADDVGTAGRSTMDDTSGEKVSGPRPPSFLDALIPVVVLIVLLTLTIVLFGIDAANGPLQVALLTSAMVAGLVAFKNGYTAAALRDAAIGGVTSAMGAIFILLAVGALIGTWNMAGTIPTVVSYGIALLRPAIFYAAVALICAVVGAVTGSSWTTAGTLGVAFVGMAPILGMSTTIAAGAVISGAYMGDKMSPLSETTVLVPSLVGGVTVSQHIRGMLWTVGPSFVVAFLAYLVIGIVDDPASSAIGVDEARDVLATAFNISPLNLLPLRSSSSSRSARSHRSSASSPSPCSPGSSPASPSPTPSRRSSTNPTRGSCSTASRPSTKRWPTGSCRRAATPRSTICSRVAACRAC